MIETAGFRLPGGMIAPGGQRHRDGWLRPLTGGDEDWLYSLAPSTRQAELITVLLARCVTRIGPHDMTIELSRELSSGDRDYLVFKLCEATFGRRMARVLRCPRESCGAKLDLDLTTDDFPVIEKPVEPSYRVSLEREDGVALNIDFRLPRGHEQERIAASARTSADELRDELVDSCVTRIAVAGGEELSYAALPPATRRALASAIEDAAPRIDLELELVCPECSGTFEIAFDPASLLFDELAAGPAALERELHVLAFHYHWSLGELLQLALPRRRRFLRLLSEELGARAGWS